jgi:hypothetical protein
MAKILLGVTLGFTVPTLLSLLLLWRQVHVKGQFGRNASASIRSPYVLVLGLGGWPCAALLVSTTLPTVPLDNDLLAGLSVGLPVGLGVGPMSLRDG